jgi:hypothetical protein
MYWWNVILIHHKASQAKSRGFRSRDRRGQKVANVYSRMLSLHCKCEVVLYHIEQYLVCFQIAGQHVTVDYAQTFYALVVFLQWV